MSVGVLCECVSVLVPHFNLTAIYSSCEKICVYKSTEKTELKNISCPYHRFQISLCCSPDMLRVGPSCRKLTLLGLCAAGMACALCLCNVLSEGFIKVVVFSVVVYHAAVVHHQNTVGVSAVA